MLTAYGSATHKATVAAALTQDREAALQQQMLSGNALKASLQSFTAAPVDHFDAWRWQPRTLLARLTQGRTPTANMESGDLEQCFPELRGQVLLESVLRVGAHSTVYQGVFMLRDGWDEERVHRKKASFDVQGRA
jgi:hypothetical protein